ncbi:MAG: hypothetical protein KF724_13560 [Phycisphaeraceae bacterium]|nr:hypothetical protein [Phycisphaeraceae bacterium]
MRCYRCGYDLRGTVDHWQNACPLSSPCPECGLELEWRRVFTADSLPRWSFENSDGQWFRTLRTLIHSLRPWRFWREIRMSMPVQRKILLYPLFLAIILFVASTLTGALLMNRVRLAAPPRDHFGDLVAMTAIVLMPWSGQKIETTLHSIIPQWGTPTPRNLGARPLNGQRPPGMVLYPRSNLPPPRDVIRFVWTSSPGSLVLMLMALAVSVATFIVLPVVRRRAKVRWSHILRAGIYALGVVIAVTIALFVAQISADPTPDAWCILAGRWEYGQWHDSQIWVIRAFPLVLFIWWLAVARHFMKLERPRAVAASVTVVGVLASLLIMVIVQASVVMRVVGMT